MVDNIADQIETIESNHYLFEPPSDEPDPELLKLLPKKNLIEQIVDVGLYFVAAFQIVCFLALIFLKDPEKEALEKTEEKSEEKPKKVEEKKKSKESKKTK